MSVPLPSIVDLPFAGPAAAIALEAGALVRQFYHSSVETEYKGDVDLVPRRIARASA